MIIYFSFTATTSPSMATATSTSLPATTTCSSIATTYFFMATIFTLFIASFMGAILWKCLSSSLFLVSISFADGGILDLCGLSSQLSILGHSVPCLIYILYSCTCRILHLLFIHSPAHCLDSICSLHERVVSAHLSAVKTH